MKRARDLIRELHRRSIWQVLGIYLVGSWVVLQVVDVVAENFGLPAWTFPFAVVLLLLGLPVVLATAFVQVGADPLSGATSETGAARNPGTVAAGAAGPGPHRGVLTWRNAIAGGVAALALWGAVAAGWLVVAGASTPEAAGAPASIAVLPFSTVHTDEDSRAFVAGLHDDLLTQLAKIDSLTVISRTSVMQYEGTRKTIREIARDLGVAVVLEGGVQRAGERVRLNVQLIEAATDAHLWAETYDEALSAANVFAIQSDLARKIANALHARLSPQTAARIAARPTESLEAYDLVARGRYVLERRGTTRAGMEAAEAMFREAIAADSGYAPAWTGFASTRHRLYTYGYIPEEEGLPAARAAVQQALALDPTLADAHVERAKLLGWDWRHYEEAEAALRRALELAPGSALAHASYSQVLGRMGRHEEAVRTARRARELDPLAVGPAGSLLSRLLDAGQNEEVIAEGNRALVLHPDDGNIVYTMAVARTLLGDLDAGIAGYRRSVELIPEDPYFSAGLAWALARAGRRDEALEALAQARQLGTPLKEEAIVLAELGDLDAAFERLERALPQERLLIPYMAVDPTASALRADPRWEPYLRKALGQ